MVRTHVFLGRISMRNSATITAILLVVAGNLLTLEPAFAYIGPGAGFAFIGSTFVFIISIFLALGTLLFWPLYWVVRKMRGLGRRRHARARRVIILGLDGLEPSLVEQYMRTGQLPNLKRLSEDGAYRRLGTTLPALSPVAWSTFQTGVNPGAHNIFDFLTRDKRRYLPMLASTDIRRRRRKFPFDFLNHEAEETVITRKSTPFWKILARYGVPCNVLRVPISYPPEKFAGNILSAMCTPDLKGTQGSFSFFTTRRGNERSVTGGQVIEFKRGGDTLRGFLEGPPKVGGYLLKEFALEINPNNESATIKIGRERELLRLNEFSRWMEVEFQDGRRKIHGICRFCLREISPEVSLYVSPINVNPERPALPVASPLIFSSWLAKRVGLFGTLGLMEDTWGRNELALDDARFLEQTYLTHAERERMFLELLDRTREGLCVCVFDASDRIQHIFWRYLDDKHPSPREGDEGLKDVIPDMYRKMDDLVGRIKAKLSKDDLFIVLSDHGFSSFRRGINLNTWLKQEGYLTLKDGNETSRDYFQDVDWSRTKAFALGLSGLYINVQGREREGIVAPQEVQRLKVELSHKLEALRDPASGERAISKVYDTLKYYKGLYADEAPDLVVGYNPGFRVSWDSVTGTVEPDVFSDNLKAWSGDHHIDPALIPGVLFCNREIKAESLHIADIAPSVLNVFSVAVPQHMEGKIVL